MNFTLHVWRQSGPKDKGAMKTYEAKNVNSDMSLLEMLDVVNQELIGKGDEPIAFDHDCREGICGTCSLVVNGVAHAPRKMLPGGKREAKTTCQTYMRDFKDGESLYIEPFRARAFPIIKDLIVDRAAFDRIIQAGGFVSAPTGSAQDGNAIPIPKPAADSAMDAAACIGCGACVAACPNASASLFTAAKITHLGDLPQGQPERMRRALAMVHQMDLETFGGCTLFGECQEACPKGISIDTIARMNRDYIVAAAREREGAEVQGTG